MTSLTEHQKQFYKENGYLHVPRVFDAQTILRLSDELDWIYSSWADHNAAWEGPWRDQYLSDEERQTATLIAINDMHLHSDIWNRATGDPRLVNLLGDLLGPNVELHHTTLHAKPPETGSPFPLHQDNAFFAHERPAFINAIIHIDDSPEEAGCLRFVPGSHLLGPLTHIRDGAPHLPTDRYSLSDTVPAPAEAGDVVFFCLWTVHGSDINRTDLPRRVVRMGYRDPANPQADGFALGQYGWMVSGRRPKMEALAEMRR